MEQPLSIQRALNNGGRIDTNTTVKLGGLEQNKHKLLECEHIILLGCGTSYHSSLWSMDIFKILDIFTTVQIFDGAEFDTKDIPKKGTYVLFFHHNLVKQKTYTDVLKLLRTLTYAVLVL